MDMNAIYLVLGLAYLAAVGWYLINVFVSSRSGSKSTSSSSSSTSSSSSSSSGSKKSHGHRREGKKCPQCQKIIDKRRTVCQHCGYEFSSPENGGEEHHEHLPDD